MKSWYIYFVVMMAICSLGCNRTASKKQVMQIGPADAQCLNCDTLGTTVRMNMIQNHYPLDTKNVYAILLNPRRKSLIFGGDWTLQKWENGSWIGAEMNGMYGFGDVGMRLSFAPDYYCFSYPVSCYPLAELNEVKIMLEKLRISLIFINLVLLKSLSLNRRMHNLYTKFVRILEICKQFSNNLVNDQGNIVRCGPVPKFSDLEVVALSLAAESESIDSEKWLFDYKLQEYKEQIPNLISRRQFNDRRKKTAGLCEAIRKRIALKMDGGEDFFLVDSKPVEVCRLARGKRCKMGQTGDFSKAPDFGYCASQNTYYFGYKLHAVCGLSGVVHSYDLSKASVHDLNYMKDIKLEYHNCSIYGDKGYIGADVQLDLFETAHIRLECPYRLNQKDWKPTFIPFAKARKRIETIFSQLSDQFLIIRNYAKITNGLFARIIGKISALTVSQYANYINNKPIGRIKYALN